MRRGAIVWVLALALVGGSSLATPRPGASGSTGAEGAERVLHGGLFLGAGFVHDADGGGGTSYRTLLNGRIRAVFEDLDGKRARFRVPVGLGASACSLSMALWVPAEEGGQPTIIAPTCLTNEDTRPSHLNGWTHGGEAPDPALVATLERVDGRSDVWTNPAPIRGRMVVERCSPRGSPFARYADLVIDARSLRASVDGRDLRVEAEGARLERPDRRLWRELRERCGGDDGGLPADPTSGAADAVVADARAPSPGFQGALDDLRVRLMRLADAAGLSRQDAARFTRWIDRATDAAMDADDTRTVHSLERFGAAIDRAANQGSIDAKVAHRLISDADRLRTHVVEMATPGLPVRSGQCPEGGAVFDTTFHVDRRSTSPSPDGSADAAFPTLAQAFEEAERREVSAIEVVVHGPGTYPVSATITRPTRIVGAGDGSGDDDRPVLEGSITNPSPTLLELRSLKMTGGSPSGAVAVDDPCAVTDVTGVTIEGAEAHGLRQRGGRLRAVGLTVRSTRGREGSQDLGTGIFLTGGVNARIGISLVSANDGGGITVEGPRTEATLALIGVSDNRVNRGLDTCSSTPPAVGGLVARDGASLSTSFARVADNRLAGVLLEGGAEGTVENSRVTGTAETDAPCAGGVNITTFEGARLSVSGFRSSHAALCGVQVARDGHLRLRRGAVSHNPIGACVGVPDYDLRLLTDGVRYANNDINLDCRGHCALPDPEDVAP